MRRLLSCLVILGFAAGLSSCKKGGDNPGPSTPPLDFTPVQKILDDSVARFDGKYFAVINVNGQEVYSKGFGGYDGATKGAIGSCTMWMSAAVIMSLVDDDLLELSDSIGKFLPVFTDHGKGKITIAQLFAHTSGFPGKSTQGYEEDETLTLAQAVDSIAKNVALINPPGTAFYYGGVSMQIGGRIAEVVSEKSWNTLFREQLATQCGLAATDYGNSTNPFIAGGARSTPNDYIKFINMILEGGLTTNGKRVLTETAVTAMIKSQVGLASINSSPYTPSLLEAEGGIYGIGNWRDFPSENSSIGTFGSHPWVNFDKRIAGFIYTNVDNNGFVSTLPACLAIRKLSRTIVQ